jgi:hypothetical protein
MTLHLRGELEARAAQLPLLCQAVQGGICSGWLLTGQPFHVTPGWSEQTVTLVPDPAQWKCLGSRHDRTDFYGEIPLATVLRDVNTDILLVLHPLDVAPMGPLDGAPHRLRPAPLAARARLSGLALAASRWVRMPGRSSDRVLR